MRWPSLLWMMVLCNIKHTCAFASLSSFVKLLSDLTQIAWGLTCCCFWAVDLVACISKTEQNWGHPVDVPCDSSPIPIQIRKFQSSRPKNNLMFCVKIRAAVCLLKQFQAWQWIPEGSSLYPCTYCLFVCISSSYRAVFLSCISQVLSQVTVAQNTGGVLQVQTAEVWRWSYCWYEEPSVPTQLASAVVLTRLNKQSLPEPDRRVYSWGP